MKGLLWLVGGATLGVIGYKLLAPKLATIVVPHPITGQPITVQAPQHVAASTGACIDNCTPMPAGVAPGADGKCKAGFTLGRDGLCYSMTVY